VLSCPYFSRQLKLCLIPRLPLLLHVKSRSLLTSAQP
jgi:hypothetical protein